jgi:hypothetical protein
MKSSDAKISRVLDLAAEGIAVTEGLAAKGGYRNLEFDLIFGYCSGCRKDPGCWCC